MGNLSSSAGAGGRRHGSRRNNQPPPQPPTDQPQREISANRYVFAAASPYPNPTLSPTPNQGQYYQYPNYYLTPPPAVPVSFPTQHENHHHLPRAPAWTPGWFPYGHVSPQPPVPYIEHQKAVTIRNDVNLKKETLKLQADVIPGRFLVSFTFDATVSGRITIVFFARENEDFELVAERRDLLPSVTMEFNQGLGQKLVQPSGTGIDFSMFEEADLLKESEADIYPLAVKAEAVPQDGPNGNLGPGAMNSQITKAVFEKDRDEYRLRVAKQILRVNGMRYELQEIYGIGNAVEGDNVDAKDPGKECVICLSETRDTTVLPCRHMCMCSGCAKLLRFQTNRCPICRQPVERLLEIKVNNESDE